jgi:hypothetical protein
MRVRPGQPAKDFERRILTWSTSLSFLRSVRLRSPRALRPKVRLIDRQGI